MFNFDNTLNVTKANELATNGAKGRKQSALQLTQALVFGVVNYWTEQGNQAALAHILQLIEKEAPAKDSATCKSFASKFTGINLKRDEDKKPVKVDGISQYVKDANNHAKRIETFGLIDLEDTEATKEIILSAVTAYLNNLGGDIFGKSEPKTKVGTVADRALIKLGKDLKSAAKHLSAQKLIEKAIVAGFDRQDLLNALNSTDITGAILTSVNKAA